MPGWQQVTFGGLQPGRRGNQVEIVTASALEYGPQLFGPQLATAYAQAVAAGCQVTISRSLKCYGGRSSRVALRAAGNPGYQPDSGGGYARLRASRWLSRASGSSSFVLGNPKAWLGTAYHEVLEKIIEIHLGNRASQGRSRRLWNQAIAAQQSRATVHVLDRRFGAPEAWPGYYLAHASVLLRAGELVGMRDLAQSAKLMSGAAVSTTIRERDFTTFGGTLIGRPDVICANEVVDYKSGAIAEQDAISQTDVIKAALHPPAPHLRIANEAEPRLVAAAWSSSSARRSRGEVGLKPSECEQEAVEAVALLDAYNDKFHRRAGTSEFASPTPQTCRW